MGNPHKYIHMGNHNGGSRRGIPMGIRNEESPWGIHRPNPQSCTQYGSAILPTKVIILPGLSRQKFLGLTPATGQIEACPNHANTCQCNGQYRGRPPPVGSIKLACVGMVLACLNLSCCWGQAQGLLPAKPRKDYSFGRKDY